MKLVDQLPVLPASHPTGAGIDPDALYTKFQECTESRGVALYAAEDEAILELATGD
jgi:hypothetical protein